MQVISKASKQQKLQPTIQSLKNILIPNFKNVNKLMQKHIDQVLNVLLLKKDKKLIQAISRSSVLQQSPLLRSHFWKLQLQTLPLQPQKWQETIQGNYIFYLSLVEKIFPNDLYENQYGLPCSKNPQFDKQLWGEIVLDTKRTHSVLSFFKKQIPYQKIYAKQQTKHSDVLARILYIWGKVNPRIRYVQGMNQLIAPLYYLEFQKVSPYAQSQVFFMFSAIMTFSIDMHRKQMDRHQNGIMGRIETLNKYLKVVDYQIWSKLDNQKVLPHHYSFRWLALLLAQQFELDQTMRLWDVLFSFDGNKRFFFLYCICLSIIKLRKEDILNNDLIGILPKLQKLKDLDVDNILDVAVKIYQKYIKVNIDKLYEKMEEQLENRNQQNQQKQNSIELSKWNYNKIIQSTRSYIVGKFISLKNKDDD